MFVRGCSDPGGAHPPRRKERDGGGSQILGRRRIESLSVQGWEGAAASRRRFGFEGGSLLNLVSQQWLCVARTLGCNVGL